MSIPFHRVATRRVIAAVAFACLPVTAFAWGSQAGDNGRYPIGADNEGPRQAIPNQTSNDVPIQYQYQSSATYYVYPSEGYMAQPAYVETQPAYVETHPPYMTYYYSSPTTVYRYDTYAAAPEYYVYRAPDYYAYSPYGADTRNINSTIRCAPVYGAARADCLHGSSAGD
jgi:hypothetical protein